ncbi:predicted protein [Arabidopsis lyrata subsp. lyrata]|uniref:Predicted protein n=1 Tax=Arabidopsis lyrata subsp. lyrata TaxID=81972 RepID=D7KEP2_ARALL|nr:F-box/LRR-repeat/kelch-repeat protein At1g09650 [Arabidopsis lyrata subsp. lyrata]EFH67102.1 predicted protein [Arabidopsis lyrata subsp. lyrata]|eukprot:XP_020867374.1 F-box/LRR-repeat/kelch-repeat protein At1g09650 [Arabidopsis lyrata subsp. lyrata]
MSKKLCLRMDLDWLPHDVVELNLERAPVASLLRFKAVSTQWKSTIESRLFQERQFNHRQQSGDPDVLMVSVRVYEDGFGEPDTEGEGLSGIECLRTLVLSSSSSLQIPTSKSSFDGLVCLYFPDRSGYVVNPITRSHRVLPLSNYQQILIDTSGDILIMPTTPWNLA